MAGKLNDEAFETAGLALNYDLDERDWQFICAMNLRCVALQCNA